LPKIQKQNVNTIEFKQLLKNPYIDYDLCKKIFNYRDEVAELQNISELKNIEGFPLDKYDRIVLYLVAE
jgi:DNA uptake protein ComE-like DNA-binding protein